MTGAWAVTPGVSELIVTGTVYEVAKDKREGEGPPFCTVFDRKMIDKRGRTWYDQC